MKKLKSNSILVRNDLIYLLVLAIGFCVVGIGSGSLASWDEAYYGIVSREIHRLGDWVHLYYFDSSFYDKPPLYFWVTAIFYAIGGISEFTSRLGSALAGVGTVIITYYIGKELFNRIVGWAGAGILLSSTDYLHYSRWATLDVANLMFFSLALLFFFKVSRSPKYWLGFWVASALAVLTKGPIIILVWGMVFVSLVFKRELILTLKNKYFLIGILLFFVTALPWHLAAFFSDPQHFWQDFIHKHYIARTTSAVEGHTGGYYYYIRTLINKYHPWIVVIPAALPWVLWRLKSSEQKFGYAILLFWIGTVFCFFTFLVKTKLQWYILPMHPALSIVIAVSIYEWFKGKPEWILKSIIVIVLFAHIPFSSVMVQDYAPEIKQIAPKVQEFVGEGKRIALYNYHEEPAAVFYFDRKAYYIDSVKHLLEHQAKVASVSMIIHRYNYEAIKKTLKQHNYQIITSVGEGKSELLLISNKK